MDKEPKGIILFLKTKDDNSLSIQAAPTIIFPTPIANRLSDWFPRKHKVSIMEIETASFG